MNRFGTSAGIAENEQEDMIDDYAALLLDCLRYGARSLLS